MRNATFQRIIIGLIVCTYACQQAQREQNPIMQAPTPDTDYRSDRAAPSAGSKMKDIASDTVSNQFISSSAAVEDGKLEGRKFIRTAELKFKVESVVNATYEIENITRRFGGFVTNTFLKSDIEHKTTTALTRDSSLESTHYSVVNNMTIRVPNTQLDTTLKSIAVLIDYLDYRIIKVDDVSLNLLENQMTQNRVARNEQRLTNAINNRGKKLAETTAAEELLLRKQEQSDDAKMANLRMQDNIAYSTITLNIYQRLAIKRELIANDKTIDAYEPGFGSRIADAFKTGYYMLETIIICIISIWSWILLGVVGYFGYTKFAQFRQKSRTN
jgi:hypothetical protein